jgi:hypothetical protein
MDIKTMKQAIRYSLFSILSVACCLASTCATGSFDASFTDKAGTVYHGGVTIPKRVTSDAK